MTDQTTSKPICRRCGAEVPPDAPHGYCMKCLFALGTAEPDSPADADSSSPGGEKSAAATLRTRIVLSLPLTEKPGDSIGRYKLLQQIGEGGCGVVYMAEQEEPVRRRVALKVIKLGMDTRQVIARFEAERQALALMDHPNIAKIFDAGATDTGRPYFVMELVRGVRITEYCDQNNLATEQRLALFTQVCQAIQHAHQKGIIHRDIKPSNVLVTLHDGVPVPKVIDFGIAKATQGRLTDQTLFTALEQFIGTPAYMSPEQAEMSGLDIDTRSDIYSLGVLLYELLTGATPFNAKELMAAGLDAMRRTIREQEPARPSTRLSTMLAADLTIVAKHRQADAPKLVHLLRGDLDWIVMKCLEKDRTRRYETANGLAGDLQRHLGNEPVLARPPSTVYRLQKAFRRNKLALTAAAAVGVILVAGVMVSTWQWRKAEAARADAVSTATAEKTAREAAQTAQRAQEYEAYVTQIGLAAAKIDSGAFDYAQELLAGTSPRLRHWEWSWLKGQCHPEIQTFVGHTEPWGIQLAALSPNGKLVATVGDPGSSAEMHFVRVWELASGRQLALLQGAAPGLLSSLAFTPDSRRLAACGVRWARVWEVEGGRQLRSFTNALAISPDGQRVFVDLDDDTNPQSLRVYDTDTAREICAFETAGIGVWQAVFSPDGQRLLTEEVLPAVEPTEYAKLTPAEIEAASRRSARYVTKVRDAVTGRQISVLRPTPGYLMGAAFSPDGKFLFTSREFAGDARQPLITRFWNSETGQEDERLALPSRRTAFSPDGKRMVAVQDADHKVTIWDLESGKAIVSLSGHSDNIQSAVFSPDGQRVLTAGNDRTARLWDATSGEQITEFKGHWAPVTQAIFSPDGQRILTASRDGTAKLWDADPLRHQVALRAHTGRIRDVKFSRDGTQVLTVGDDFAARLWNAETGAGLYTFPHQDAVRFAEFSLDGKQILTVAQVPRTNYLDTSWTWSRVARVWNAHTGTQTFSLQGELVWGISRDGKHLLKMEREKSALGAARHYAVKIRELATGTEREFATTPVSGREIAEFSRGGKFLAVATETNCLKVFELASGKELTSLTLTGGLARAQFAPGDAILCTEDWEGHGIFWEVQTWRALGSFSGASPWHPFSSDGQFLITGENTTTARIWEMATGREVSVLKGHWGRISAAAFFSDGKRVITGSDDMTVKLWDLKTGRELLTLSHAAPVVSVAVAPDGKRIVTAAGNTATIWTAQGWEPNAVVITK